MFIVNSFCTVICFTWPKVIYSEILKPPHEIECPPPKGFALKWTQPAGSGPVKSEMLKSFCWTVLAMLRCWCEQGVLVLNVNVVAGEGSNSRSLCQTQLGVTEGLGKEKEQTLSHLAASHWGSLLSSSVCIQSTFPVPDKAWQKDGTVHGPPVVYKGKMLSIHSFFSKLFGVTLDYPYFVATGKKVYVLYDPTCIWSRMLGTI